jgi:hypothetical protein
MAKIHRFRKVADPVCQGATSAHCWAAALEWWLKITPNRTKLSKGDLISMYAKKYPDGSLDPVTEFPLVKDENGMDSENISGSVFTSEYIDKKLALGHLYVGYERPGSSFGHCIVVWGISGSTVNFMDPAKCMHWYRQISFFEDAKMTVVWPVAATPTPP